MSTNPLRSLVTLVLLGALLAGCGGPATEPAAEPAATPLPPTPTALPPTPTPTVEPEAEAPSPVAAAPEPVGLRPDAPPYAVHGPYWVGYKPVVIGEGTDHPIDAGLWYPALNPNGDPEEIIYPMPWKIPSMPLDTEPLAYGHALLDATIDESGAPYPLVVFSPGLGTAAPWYSNLIEHYASYGFVVLAPEHIETWDAEVRDKWSTSIDRPLAIKRTLDYAEQATAAGGDMAGLIDMQHVAVEGHSYGGYTALAMAGAQYDLDAFNARCAALPPDDPNTFFCAPLVSREADMAARAGLDVVPEGLWPSFGDPRVTAIIPIAGDAYLFDKAGLSKITIPMMAIGGTADTGTPYDWGSKLSYDNTSSAKKVLVTLDGAEHTITTSCENLPWMHDTPFGGWICFDPVWDKDRGMDLINHFSTAFLLDTLKGDAEAAAALAPENVAFHNVRYETNAYGAEPAAAAETEPAGLRPDAPAYGVHGPYAVGTREFSVEIDGRTTPVTVWYPAANPSGVAEEITYSMDVGDAGLPPYPVLGNAIRDAEPDPSGAPYPLAVWSHGAYLYRQTNAYLAEHLASQGFVVVAGNHEDNWGTFPASNVPSNVSRPADISAWIDFAEEQTASGGTLAGLIDTEHIAAGGHSYGGYTALAVAGARFNPTWYLDVACAENPLAEDDPLNDCANMKRELPELAALAGLDAVPEGLWPSWQDPRVDAIFLLAPSSVFGAEGAAAVTIPAMSLTGSDDPMQDAALHVYLTHENLASANKNLVVFQEGGHAMFLNDCQSATGMANVAYEWCSDAVWDTDRVHDLTNHFVTAFLLAELKGDRYAAAALSPENVAFPGIQYETTAYTDAAAAVLDGDTVAKIEAIAGGAMTNYSIPGLAIGVVKNGELVYAKGLGDTNVADGTPVTPQSLFGLASLSKMFTAAAIMQLVEQGLIDLDAPVTDYLPEFRLDDPRYTAITVRQLLAHTSGLPWLPATTEVRSEELGFHDPDTEEGALARMVAGLDGVALVADPGGGQVMYSNTAFDVLGDIVATVSGQPYETYMRDNIFKPLGMESTTFVLDEADPALLATGYQTDPESGDLSAWEFFPYNPQHSPSAGLISNVDDMSRWATALLNEGELDGARILEAGSVEEIWSPSSTMGWGGLLQDYGLGWILAEDAGHRLVWHVGGVPGFYSNLILAPEDGIAVVTMLNLNNYLQDEPWYATEVGTAVMYELLGIAE